MKRFISIVVILLFCGTTAISQQKSYGCVCDIVSFRSYTDENFNTFYKIALKNKTDKRITSIQVTYAHRNPYEQFNLAKVEDVILIHQLDLSPGETKESRYFTIEPEHTHYIIYGIFIRAVRFSDGTVVRRTSNQGGPNQSFGDYWPSN